MRSTIHCAGLSIVLMLIAQPLHAQSQAGSYYQPPAQPAENAAQQRTANPDPHQDRAATMTTPASLEEQVTQLQNEVAELQTIVQQLRALIPAPGDALITRKSPAPGLTCDGSSLMAANDIIERAYGLTDGSQRPYPNDTLVMMWSGCRR